MKTKWYSGLFLILLTLLIGLASQQNSMLPNQVIVLHFNGDSLDSRITENAVSLVERELQAFGADKIQISDNKNGKVTISYFSHSDIESIKKVLLEDEAILVDFTSISSRKNNNVPSNDKQSTFDLDIYELQSWNDYHSGIDAVPVDEIKAERFVKGFNQNYLNSNTSSVGCATELAKVGSAVNRKLRLCLDLFNCQSPETRAGPTA